MRQLWIFTDMKISRSKNAHIVQFFPLMKHKILCNNRIDSYYDIRYNDIEGIYSRG